MVYFDCQELTLLKVEMLAPALTNILIIFMFPLLAARCIGRSPPYKIQDITPMIFFK